VGYLSKSFVGSILELILLREFLENKVETLAIYKPIKSMYNYRYFEKGDYPRYSSREGFTVQLK